jgi:hypothetical protein
MQVFPGKVLYARCNEPHAESLFGASYFEGVCELIPPSSLLRHAGRALSFTISRAASSRASPALKTAASRRRGLSLSSMTPPSVPWRSLDRKPAAQLHGQRWRISRCSTVRGPNGTVYGSTIAVTAANAARFTRWRWTYPRLAAPGRCRILLGVTPIGGTINESCLSGCGTYSAWSISATTSRVVRSARRSGVGTTAPGCGTLCRRAQSRRRDRAP